MSYIFNTFIYEPLANLMVWFYQGVTFGSLALSIILLTLLVRIILYPLYHKAIHHQAAMARLRPDMDRIKKEYADKQEQAKKIIELYKENNIKPFQSFMMILVQIPILFALFKVFTTGLKSNFSGVLYPFIILSGSLDIL